MKRLLIFLTLLALLWSACTSTRPSGGDSSGKNHGSPNTVKSKKTEAVPEWSTNQPKAAREARKQKAMAMSQKRGIVSSTGALGGGGSGRGGMTYMSAIVDAIPHETENYNYINENTFQEALGNPLSTFSIDVDAASYSNVRRFLKEGRLPYTDAVRIEEMINYFSYSYDPPKNDEPFSIDTEVTSCPWNKGNLLARIGLQGQVIETENLPPSNLVFLLDVSGSMNSPNKLPLVKAGLRLLVNELRPEDRISLVVYAGAAGLVLPSTPGTEKALILKKIDQLSAGGSTAGGEGIQLAYKTAKDNFLQHGNNRVILATDGDFNVGVSSDSELIRMVEKKRKDNIYLTVLGFGSGNLKDSRMEQIADKGNGNYYYIDSILEAKKVLITELGGTLLTIAKDVKIQVEFNPFMVKSYRLVGYENRKLDDQDFDDDKKDAGELGAGHQVTALYELVPADPKKVPDKNDLKYQTATVNKTSKEFFTVKLRYKRPKETTSNLIELAVNVPKREIDKLSPNQQFAAAVAEFGMILRDSEFKGNSSYESTMALAKSSVGADEFGYRTEFLKLVEMAELLDNRKPKD